MDKALITITTPGLLSSIQDTGRFGLRHLGIPWAGALTPCWQQMANALVGNPLEHSIIECFEGGLQFTTEGAPLRLAVMGANDLDMRAVTASETLPVKPGRSYLIPPGSVVKLASTGSFRHAVLAFQGLETCSQLGSAATYAKAGLGGIKGRALASGDTLPLAAANDTGERHCSDPLASRLQSDTLRVIMGPQDDHFSAAGCEAFLNGEYRLGTEADRMGARLTGPVIEHRDEASRDIVSDAIVPGSIQVPGNGQPIVLLNDAHTAGGYPKIATVLSIDLPLLGLKRHGALFRFQALDMQQAIDAVRLQQQELHDAIRHIKVIGTTRPDTHALLSNNLIDGVTDGQLH